MAAGINDSGVLAKPLNTDDAEGFVSAKVYALGVVFVFPDPPKTDGRLASALKLVLVLVVVLT